MNESAFDVIAAAASVLKLDISSEEFAILAEDSSFSEDAIEAVKTVFSYLKVKKQQTTVMTLLKMSRLPTKEPKTFENFDFSLLKGRDVERLKALPSLSAIYAHRNLAFIGPAGTGKTHLAQAFGYECCQRGMKTYFIKATELRDRFSSARRSGKTDSCLSGLVRPSCLIVDEIGHCEFDKENTRLFFDLIDRRYNKEGNFNMIFTSNKNPALWREDFNEDATLLCALDRIFDDATVFKLRGDSFRGKKLETVSLQTSKVQDVAVIGVGDERLGEISLAIIQLKEGANAAKLRPKIENILGEKYCVRDKYEQEESLYRTMKSEKFVIYLILAFILILAAFNIIGALGMLILEKKTDTAVLFSMGASKSLIQRVFVYEGLMVSALGGVAGTILGAVICLLQQTFHIVKLGGGGSHYIIPYYPVQMRFSDLLIVLATILIISFLTSLIPAYNLKKSNLYRNTAL